MWPQIRDAVRFHHHRSPAQHKSVRKLTSEVTTWELARENLIVTPGIRAVLDAAEEWFATWEELPPTHEEDDPTDRRLYEAIAALRNEEEEKKHVRILQR